MTSCQASSGKEVFSKRKGSKFFPFKVNLFQKDSKIILTELPPLKMYLDTLSLKFF